MSDNLFLFIIGHSTFNFQLLWDIYTISVCGNVYPRMLTSEKWKKNLSKLLFQNYVTHMQTAFTGIFSLSYKKKANYTHNNLAQLIKK